MKRLIMLAVLCAFVLGGMAYATETRVMTMGDVNNIVKDEANIWLFPSTINYYPKLFIAEYDDEDFYNIGAHFLFGEDGDKPMVLGTYFSTERYDYDLVNYDKDLDEVYHEDQRLTLFYGREISEMPFGFYFGYWSQSYKVEDTVVARGDEEGLTRFEFGFGLSPMEKKLDLSIGLALTSFNDKEYNGADYGLVDESKPSGNMDFAVMARYWMDPMGKYTLVPHFGLFYSKKGIEYYYDDGSSWTLGFTEEWKDMIFDLGLGFNYDAMENVLVVGDFGFQLGSYKETYDYADPDMTDPDDWQDKWLTLPYFKIGIDAQVFKWMDFRCGIAKYWEKETYEPNAEMKRIWSTAYADTYFGAGFNWGKLTIDAAIEPDFLGNGPYFISGEYTSSGLAERISVKYAF